MTVPAPDHTTTDGWPTGPVSTNGVHPAATDDGDLFEPDWNRPKRANRLTFVLLAALVAALAFAGGVAVQKQHDASLVATAGRARGAGGFGGAGGFAAAGGQGSGGGQGGGAGGQRSAGGQASGAAGPGGGSGGQGGDSGGQGTAGGQGVGSAPAEGAPVAIGTVKAISGTTLTITNFAGTVVTVTVPPTATVTTPGLGGLAVGATVSVAGTTNPDGTVTATSVTSRRTG